MSSANPPGGAGGESFPQWEFLMCGFHATVISVLLEEVPQDNTTTLFWWRKCLRATRPCFGRRKHLEQPRGFGDPPAAPIVVPVCSGLCSHYRHQSHRQRGTLTAITSINYSLLCLVATGWECAHLGMKVVCALRFWNPFGVWRSSRFGSQQEPLAG